MLNRKNIFILLFGIIAIAVCVCVLSYQQKRIQQRNDIETISNRIRFVLFVHAGDETKPSSPFLIYTNKNDTTYLKYCRMDARETIYVCRFPLSDEIIQGMKKYHVSDSVFDSVSNYVAKNNTQMMEFAKFGANGNYWVFFQDEQDSAIFTLDGSDWILDGSDWIEKLPSKSRPFFEDLRKFVPEFDK